MKYLYLSCAAAALLAFPVAAQNEDTSGGRIVVGAIVGLDSLDDDLGSISDDDVDLLVGATIGYDYETRSGLIFGVEVEYTDSSAGASANGILASGDRVAINAGPDLYLGVRLGFRLDRFGFLYVKGGYTDATIEAEYDGGNGVISGEDSFDGYRIGVGGEIDLGDQFAIRVEYRYSDYGYIGSLGIEASRSQGILAIVGRF